MMTVTLPWPSKTLHPNARPHWATKAKAVKAAWEVKAAGLERLDARALQVTAIFRPPDNRHRDLDGMLTALKPALDGVSDVLGVDDRFWAIVLHRDVPKPPLGQVTLNIEVLA